MSTVVTITTFANSTQSAQCSTLNVAGIGLSLITQGLKELDFAYEKQKELVDCDNKVTQVDLLIKTLDGKQVGVIENEEGISFLAQDMNCSITLDAIKKIKQKYSKHLMLYELKSKGYQKIKEEKLPNGSIRLIVEKQE